MEWKGGQHPEHCQLPACQTPGFAPMRRVLFATAAAAAALCVLAAGSGDPDPVVVQPMHSSHHTHLFYLPGGPVCLHGAPSSLSTLVGQSPLCLCLCCTFSPLLVCVSVCILCVWFIGHCFADAEQHCTQILQVCRPGASPNSSHQLRSVGPPPLTLCTCLSLSLSVHPCGVLMPMQDTSVRSVCLCAATSRPAT